MAGSIEVIKAGLETSVQDFPGRYGFWEQGFPPSGPFDMWSFRLANILVGNEPAAAGLECQFMGPTLVFSDDCVIALTGAEMNATLDGEALPQWESVAVAKGQTLACGFASVGARAYLAVSGGIDVMVIKCEAISVSEYSHVENSTCSIRPWVLHFQSKATEIIPKRFTRAILRPDTL